MVKTHEGSFFRFSIQATLTFSLWGLFSIMGDMGGVRGQKPQKRGDVL